MKYKYVLVLMLAQLPLLPACTAPSNQSIIISSALAPGGSCNFQDFTLYVEGGSLDMSVYKTNSSYYQVFAWENDLQNISVNYNGTNITEDTPNTFIANRIELTYDFVGQANPPPGIINFSAAIFPGALPTTNSVGVYLLTPAAADFVYPIVRDAAIAAQEAKSFTLNVTFDLAGTLVGGGAAATNPITYPITLFYGIAPFPAYTLSCPNGSTPETTSCNIPGYNLPYCVCTGAGADGGVVPCPPIAGP